MRKYVALKDQNRGYNGTIKLKDPERQKNLDPKELEKTPNPTIKNSIMTPKNKNKKTTTISTIVSSIVPRIEDISHLPKITARQHSFLVYYLTPESETFGNATRSYLRAYDPMIDRRTISSDAPKYRNATIGSRYILNNPKCRIWIQELNILNGFNDDVVDANHLKLIKQNENLPVKGAMIKHYNELKGRIKSNNNNPQINIELKQIIQDIQQSNNATGMIIEGQQ